MKELPEKKAALGNTLVTFPQPVFINVAARRRSGAPLDG
jgi:hypothetical protein